MRAGLIFAALALGLAAPLAAQDAAAAAPAPPPAPGPIVLVSGPDALLATLGTAPLDPAAEMCLGPDETAVLVSERVAFSLLGDGCFTVGLAESEAVEIEEYQASEAIFRQWLFAELRAKDDSTKKVKAPPQDLDVLLRLGNDNDVTSGGSSDGDLAEANSETESVTNEEFSGESYSAVTDETGRDSEPIPASPNKRGPSAPRPLELRIASGSPTVLDRLSIGTRVNRSAVLCLSQNEQVTIVANIGQSVTYKGPGCLRRQDKPSRENIGALVFG